MSARRCRLEFVRQPWTPTHDYSEGPSQWYWRFIAANGKETARSSETYRNRVDCIRSAELTTGCYGVRELEHKEFCWRLVRDHDRNAEKVNVRWVK